MSFLNILYKVYSFCIALPIFVLITIFVSTSVIIAGFLGDTDIVSYYLPKFWSKCAFWLFLLRVKIEGRENIKKEESYVFLANHQGYYDIFLVYGYLGHNFKWMMKEYLRKIPFVGYACTKCKQIYLADGISGISKAVQQSRETLQGGMSMVIFPEGTRTRTGKMAPFTSLSPQRNAKGNRLKSSCRKSLTLSTEGWRRNIAHNRPHIQKGWHIQEHQCANLFSI